MRALVVPGGITPEQRLFYLPLSTFLLSITCQGQAIDDPVVDLMA